MRTLAEDRILKIAQRAAPEVKFVWASLMHYDQWFGLAATLSNGRNVQRVCEEGVSPQLVRKYARMFLVDEQRARPIGINQYADNDALMVKLWAKRIAYTVSGGRDVIDSVFCKMMVCRPILRRRLMTYALGLMDVGEKDLMTSDLHMRVALLLVKAGFRTIHEVHMASDDKLLSIERFGKVSLEHTRTVIGAEMAKAYEGVAV